MSGFTTENTESTEMATPETDAFWKDIITGNYQPSWWVVAERMRDHAKRFERKRDQVREVLQAVLKTGDRLERERDEALAKLHPDRALEWLRVHYQACFGDRKNWSEDIADSFYRDTATLTLFCQNFKFSKEAAE